MSEKSHFILAFATEVAATQTKPLRVTLKSVANASCLMPLAPLGVSPSGASGSGGKPSRSTGLTAYAGSKTLILY